MYTIKNNTLQVLSLYLGDYNAKFFLREISRKTGLALKTCQNTLSNLEKDHILIGKIDGKNKYFSLNLENIDTKHCLLHAEIFAAGLFLSKFPQLKLFVKELPENLPVIVFGSYSAMRANKNSDIDILVVTNKVFELPEHLLPYAIHKINLSEKAFHKSLQEKEPLIEEILKNHKIINNPSFLVSQLWGFHAKQKA